MFLGFFIVVVVVYFSFVRLLEASAISRLSLLKLIPIPSELQHKSAHSLLFISKSY